MIDAGRQEWNQCRHNSPPAALIYAASYVPCWALNLVVIITGGYFDAQRLPIMLTDASVVLDA